MKPVFRLLPLAILITQIAFTTAPAQDPAAGIARKPLVIGETLIFHSDILNEERTINLYLPAGYQASDTSRYPVIYLLDGSMDEDLLHVVGLIQFGTFPWLKWLPEAIVVGIANVDRKRDFTFPSENKNDRALVPTSGGSASFIRFISDELQPLINKTYRTVGPNTLIGQSLGGLLATEILLKKPDLFDRYILISPSLWWNKESLLALEKSVYKTDKQIFISIGKEGPLIEDPTRRFYQILTSASPDNQNIHFRYYEKYSHGDLLHIALYDIFRGG